MYMYMQQWCIVVYSQAISSRTKVMRDCVNEMIQRSMMFRGVKSSSH